MAELYCNGYMGEAIDKRLQFEDYMLLTARQFGALILMRDDPLSAKIPEKLEPSNYYSEQREKAILLKQELSGSDNAGRLAYGQKVKDEKIASLKETIAAHIAEKEYCQTLLDQVKRWGPPTTEHVGLKRTAIKQIEDALSSYDYSDMLAEAERKSPLEYALEALAKCDKDIAYYEKQEEEEIARTSSCNEWLQKLRKSLDLTSESVTV